MHALDHQLHIVEGSACGGEAGAGLDVVSACLADDVAHLFLFLVGQQAGLNDDLEHLVAHSLLDGTDVLTDSIVFLVLQAADVDDHVHLGSAVLNGSLGLKGLAGGIHSTQREAHHAAHRDAARHILDRLLYIAGVDADGCGVVGNGLITDGLDLGPGGLRLQQGMIDMGEDFFTGHIIFLHQFLLARRTFAMPTALRAIAVTDAVAPMMPRTRPETRNAKPFRPRFIIPYLHCFVT